MTDFIDEIAPYVVADMKRSGVLASLTLAQAALESNWGRSGLAREGKNLFGIKGRPGELWPTWEVVNGRRVEIAAYFRHYETWEGSIRDHSDMLRRLSRYRHVVGERDYRAACRAIQDAGYATDPAYAAKLIRMIEQYGLNKYDVVEAVDVITVKSDDGRVLAQGERRADGVSWVPVRAVAEALGASVAWDEKTKTVTLSVPAGRKA